MAVPLKAGKGSHCQALPDAFCSRLQGLGLRAVDQPGVPVWPVVLASNHAQVGSCSRRMIVSSTKAYIALSQEQSGLYLAPYASALAYNQYLLVKQASASARAQLVPYRERFACSAQDI